MAGKELINKIRKKGICGTIKMIAVKWKKTERDLNRFEELEKFRLVISEDIINLEYVKENLNSWNSAYEKANQIEWPKWPTDKKVTLELKDIAKSTRDGIKKSYNKEVSKILLYDSAEANENIYNMYGILKAIENLIIEFSKKFAERKKEKNIVDFNDIDIATSATPAAIKDIFSICFITMPPVLLFNCFFCSHCYAFRF